MRKAPTAKQQRNWERFAREARARAKANKGGGSPSSATSRGSQDADAASAARRRAAKKAAKTRSTWHYKAKKAVKDHPVLATMSVAGGAAVSHPKTRTALAR